MLNRFGISEIISLLLIALITASLSGTALMWGMPLINKRQDSSKIDKLYSYFDEENSNSIMKKIEFVSRNGGQETFTSDIKGTWIINDYSLDSEKANSIDFITFSKVSNVAISTEDNDIGWVSLTSGGECPPNNGIVGLDSSYVVCAKAEPFSDEYKINYRIWFRDLYDSSSTRVWRINVTNHESGLSSKETSRIRISQGDVITDNIDGETFITTKIKILLV